MQFKCKDLSISDEPFGCTITFSGNEEVNEDNKYLMLQRTYAEDDFETDYYYIESSEQENSGELSDCRIELNRNNFKIEWKSSTIDIKLKEDSVEHKKLITAIKKVIKGIGNLDVKS